MWVGDLLGATAKKWNIGRVHVCTTGKVEFTWRSMLDSSAVM